MKDSEEPTERRSEWMTGFLASEQLRHDNIRVKRVFIDINDGNLHDGILFSQIVYWHMPDKHGHTRLRYKRDGHRWLAKTTADWWEECRVDERTARDALSRIAHRGLIIKESRFFKGKKTTMIRLVWEVFEQRVKEMLAISDATERHQTVKKNWKATARVTTGTSKRRPTSDSVNDAQRQIVNDAQRRIITETTKTENINTSPTQLVATAPSAPVVPAPQTVEPQHEPAIAALMESIITEPGSPAIKDEEPHAEGNEVLPPPPSGLIWIESSVSTLQGTAHLAKRDAKLPKALCKAHLKHMGITHPTSAPCAECVRIAAKPKPAPKPAIYSSDALYDAIGAFSFGGGDAADLEPHRVRIGVIRKALAKYVCDKLGREPNADEIAAVVANVVAMPGEYRRRFKDREIAKGASTFMDAYLELFKNGNGTGNGAHYVWRGKEWPVYDGMVNVEIEPGIHQNVPASPGYWAEFVKEREAKETHAVVKGK